MKCHRFFVLGLGITVSLCGCGAAAISSQAAGTDAETQDTAQTDAASTDGSVDASGCSVTDPHVTGTVVTESGLVVGANSGEAWSWLGIPYAAPPVGAARWKDPQAHACWDTRDAKVFGAKCLQKNPTTGAIEGDEDCLILNIFAPPVGVQKPMPVLVFIHGGGNIQGSTSETILGGKPLYAGQHLAKGASALVVTLQYRLGPLGWLSLPELTKERGGPSGNQGLRDQLYALGWIQRNIARFGGDSYRVLLFGESAGAVDTCALVASPLAKGLFSAALMESGGCSQPKQDAAESAQSARVDQGSCGKAADRLACLRAADATKLLAEMPGSISIGDASFAPDPGKYGPVVDGGVLPESPMDALAAGHANFVPFAVGTNSEEVAKLLTVSVSTAAELQAALASGFGTLGADAVSKIQAVYAASAYASPQAALVAAYSDVRFVCPARAIARAAVKGGNSNVFRYFFTRQAPGAKGPIPASHGIELPYIFGSIADIPGYTLSGTDGNLVAAMQGYWGNLARGGPLTASGAPTWDPYIVANDNSLELGQTIAMKLGIHTAACDLWSTLLPGY